ncbi:MAG: ABC transporter permease [candidate division Zixibacteria bacterium]|nr:ABC transporter permease [candidate division Zixibacteria bacterium]
MAGFEFFVARRYLGGGKYFTTLSTKITTIGVAVSVSAILLFLSAHNGFENEIRTRILGATAHVTIFANTAEGLMRDYDAVMKRASELPEVIGTSPFIYYKSGIQSRSTGDGVVVRGIDPEAERMTGSLKDNILFGKYSFEVTEESDQQRPLSGIMLGINLADRLAVGIGDPVILYSISDKTLSPTSIPKKGFFRVSAIFKTGFHEFDTELAYISLADAQSLFLMDSAVTGVHLKLADIFQAEELKPQIEELLGPNYEVAPWNELYNNLFTWVEMERLVIYLVFTLIILVAAFSVVSTLVMIVLEKSSEIAALKTIGATPVSIRKIFLINGFTIGTVGALSGSIIALILIAVQNEFHVLKLPPDVYFISYLPFKAFVSDFLKIDIATLTICLLAAIYPARKAASLSVVEALRR